MYLLSMKLISRCSSRHLSTSHHTQLRRCQNDDDVALLLWDPAGRNGCTPTETRCPTEKQIEPLLLTLLPQLQPLAQRDAAEQWPR